MLETVRANRDHDLKDKIALVTGGGRGIGAAIASELALRGAHVGIGYCNSAEQAVELAERLAGLGLKAEARHLDVRSPDQISQVVKDFAEHRGGLDILVNNAGVAHVCSIQDVDSRTLNEMIDVNVKGVFHSIKEALPYLRSGGRIVNIGSISSDFMPYARNSLYVMTKSAVAGLTRGLARELAERRITINNVQPGRIETELLREALGERFESAQALMPLGRFGDVSEVANLVAFLCSREADYVTGASLRVDGGASI
uniref:SDR family NAD(P)-dependent oxidoreductase n=1 Tax=uncultured Sphingomonas sp. TaxID=158754 RepID=UPI0035CAF076